MGRRWSRRRVIGAAALALGAGCVGDDSDAPEAASPAPDRAPEPAAWLPPEPVDAVRFAWGVSSGDATADGVVLSLRTDAAVVDLVVKRADGAAWTDAERREDLFPVDQIVKVELAGLEADTAYTYAWFGADGRSVVGRFRTALGPGGLRKITFGATSCLGGNRPWGTLTAAAAAQLDFFLLLGDTVYADGSPDLEAYRASWRSAATVQGFQDLTASTSLVAVWDDHEVEESRYWYQVSPERFTAAKQAFLEALPMRSSADRMYRILSWGDSVDVFALDCRGERTKTDYLSPEQFAWVKDGLRASRARFKIVMSSVPMTAFVDLIGAFGAEDRWEGYPAQREGLIATIVDEEIGGVLFVAGDFHFASKQFVDPPGQPGEGLVEVLAGPGGSRINPVPAAVEADGRDLGPQFDVLLGAWNALLIEVDPGTGQVALRWVDDAGAVLIARTVTL